MIEDMLYWLKGLVLGLVVTVLMFAFILGCVHLGEKVGLVNIVEKCGSECNCSQV